MDDKESGGSSNQEKSPKMALELNEFGEIVDKEGNARPKEEPGIRFDEYGELIDAPSAQTNTQPEIPSTETQSSDKVSEKVTNTKANPIKPFKPTRGGFDR